MEGEFTRSGSACSPRGSQYVHGFFSSDDKQESIRIEHSAPDGAIISNQTLEGGTSTMVVVKWSEKVKGYGDNIDSPLYGGLYREEDD